MSLSGLASSPRITLNNPGTIGKNTFFNIMDKCIPKSVLPPKRRNCPWLTKQLVQVIRKRNTLLKGAKISGDCCKYNRFQNKPFSQLRLAKKAFFQKINPKQPKEFWKACKLFYKSSKSSIPSLTTCSDGIIAQSRQKRLSFSLLALLPILTLPIVLLTHLMASTQHTSSHS